MLHDSCLDLWREKNDQLVRQAKVIGLLGPKPALQPQTARKKVCSGIVPASRERLSLTFPQELDMTGDDISKIPLPLLQGER